MPWINTYGVIHCFVERGQSDDFQLRFGISKKNYLKEQANFLGL